MYEALVARVDEIKAHYNADRLEILTVHGHQIISGIDNFKVGDIGLLFVCDGQLSEVYAEANDCIGYTDPITHEKRGGYFGKNRRVRAQGFRGEKSEGYFAPLTSLSFTGGDISNLTEGTTITEFNGVPICNKYYTPATIKAMKGGTKKTRKENKCFAKHVDTVQLKFIDSLPENSIVYITEKLHGTSGRFGYVLDEIPLKRTWKDRILRRKSVRTIQEYRHLHGTRNVVMGDTHNGYYGNEQFRYNAVEPLRGSLHKGEILYYELVGYTTEGASIMPSPSTDSLKDKVIKKQYGARMEYKYGCLPNECRLFVYRITRVNEDGIVTELPWAQVKKRAEELGLQTVPELGPITLHLDSQDFNDIIELSNNLMDGPSILDPSHIREGVVLRVESEYGSDFIKNKNYTFKVLEGIIKEQDDYVDMEEAS